MADGKIVIDTALNNSGLTTGLDNLKKAVGKVGKTIAAAFAIQRIKAWSDAAQAAYVVQMQGEKKLATVMNQRLKATQAEYGSIMKLTAAEQQLGIIGDEVQLAGAQQLATFVTATDSLEKLIPAMNHLLAQQMGYNASAQDAVDKANMMGKVLQGEVGALKEVGISFSAAEEQVLRYANESERAAMLAQVIVNNVGEMNYALADTDYGRQIQLANALGDIKEQFGAIVNQIKALFIPVLTVAADVLARVASYARQLVQAFANLFQSPSKSGLSQKNDSLISSAGSAADAEQQLAGAIGEASDAAKGALAGFDELNVLQESVAGMDSAGTTLPSIGSIEWSDDVEVSPTVQAAFEKLKALFEPLSKISLEPLRRSLEGLKEALVPFGRTLFAGLEWAWYNLFIPLAEWTVEDFLPVFLEAVAAGLELINDVAGAVGPALKYLWDNFLVHVAEFVGGILVQFLEDLAVALRKIGDWIAENPTAFNILATGFTILLTAMNLKKLTDAAGGIAALTGSLSAFWPVLAVVGLAEIIAHWDQIIAKVKELKEEAEKLFQIFAGNDDIENGYEGMAESVENWTDEEILFFYEQVAERGGAAEEILNRLAESGELTNARLAKLFDMMAEGKLNNLTDENIEKAIGNLLAIGTGADTAAVNLEKLSQAVEKAKESAKGNKVFGITTAYADDDTSGMGFNPALMLGGDTSTVETAIALVQSAWGVVPAWFRENVIVPLTKSMAEFWKNVGNAGKGALTAIQTEWAKAPDWFSTTVLTPLYTLFKAFWDGQKAIFDETWAAMSAAIPEHLNGWLSAFEVFLNHLRTGVNEIIDGLNSIQVDAMGVSISFDIPRLGNIALPRLAQGAVIPANREFLAVLGDQKNGRNLEAPEALIRQIVREESGGQEVNVRFEGSLAQLARVLKPIVEKETRRTGESLIMGG